MKTVTFRVTPAEHQNVWRKIELSSDQTLADLHLAIQDAFSFDNDHLYSFFMNNRAWDRSAEYTILDGVEPYDDGSETEPSPPMTEDDIERLLHIEAKVRGVTYEEIRAEYEVSQEIKRQIAAKAAARGTPEQPAVDAAFEGFLQREALRTGIPIEQIREQAEAYEQIWLEANQPAAKGNPDARAAVIDRLGLMQGKEFLYIFDYGDEWHFNIHVDAISEPVSAAKYPRIVESHGKAPAQYA